MDARQRARQLAARPLQLTLPAALPCDGAARIRPPALLSGGRVAAAPLDARDDACARPRGRRLPPRSDQRSNTDGRAPALALRLEKIGRPREHRNHSDAPAIIVRVCDFSGL